MDYKISGRINEVMETSAVKRSVICAELDIFPPGLSPLGTRDCALRMQFY